MASTVLTSEPGTSLVSPVLDADGELFVCSNLQGKVHHVDQKEGKLQVPSPALPLHQILEHELFECRVDCVVQSRLGEAESVKIDQTHSPVLKRCLPKTLASTPDRLCWPMVSDQFNTPTSIAFDPDGIMYVCDMAHGAIRECSQNPSDAHACSHSLSSRKRRGLRVCARVRGKAIPGELSCKHHPWRTLILLSPSMLRSSYCLVHCCSHPTGSCTTALLSMSYTAVVLMARRWLLHSFPCPVASHAVLLVAALDGGVSSDHGWCLPRCRMGVRQTPKLRERYRQSCTDLQPITKSL